MRLDRTLGSEISKTRPALILSTNVVNERRQDGCCGSLIDIAEASLPLLVPVQCAGRTVVAVTDQIRAIAKERLLSRLGTISRSDMEAVEAGVRRILELA